jgi:hypothetical protein
VVIQATYDEIERRVAVRGASEVRASAHFGS